MKKPFFRIFALVVAAFSLAGCAPGAEPFSDPAVSAAPPNARLLFLHNCAHCHAADATGDEGPDLHHLDLTNEWIANRIRKGKAGQMTAFEGKLPPDQIQALVAYVQSLK